MRKAIALVLLIVLGTMPLQTTAQVSVPAVDLQCLPSADLVTNGTMVYENQNSSTGGPIMWMDGFNPDRLNDTVICKVSNPNSYVERIEIQAYADGLVVSAPGSITLAPNGEESFNVTVVIDQRMSPSIRTLTVTATVVEANGAPPPNLAESELRGDIYISTDYKYGGCYTVNTPWEIVAQWRLVSFDIFIGTGVNNTSGELPGYNANVTIQLNYSAAPLHSENFALLTWMGCYDNVIFHRVISGFVIQGGDFVNQAGTGGHAAKWYGYCNGQAQNSSDGCAQSSWTIPDEADNGLEHRPGSLAMAKTKAPHTGGSQFYIIPSDSTQTSHLDGIHTVFGEIISGQEHVDAISKLETGQNDRPVHNVTIINATLHYGTDSDGDGTPDDFDEFPDDENETTDSDGDGVGDNSDAFPNDANETHDDDSDGVGNNSDAFPDDPDETHDDDGDGVGNNTDVFPQDPDEQFDKDGDGVGDNADDFPDNKYASNWSTVYAAVGTLIVLLIGAGVMISRMKKEDELPNVPASNELEQLEKQIEELEKKKSEMLGKQDPTELMFED